MIYSLDSEYHKLCDTSSTGKVHNWREKKLKNLVLSRVYNELGFDKKSERVSYCGSYLEFKKFHDGHLKLHKANFCKDRLCPLCSWRRSLKIFGQVSQIMDKASEDPDIKYIFVTFTIKNVKSEKLSEAIDELMKGYHNLFRISKVKKLILGGFRALEVTYNKNIRSKSFDTFHPHLHCVFAVKRAYFSRHSNKYISQKEWVSFWRKSINLDYDPIVFVEKISEENNNLKHAVCEVAKYSVKDSDYLFENEEMMKKVVFTLSSALSGRRLISFRGVFARLQKELGLDDVIDGDLVQTGAEEENPVNDELNYIIVRYKWHIGIQYLNYYMCDDNWRFIRKESEGVG